MSLEAEKLKALLRGLQDGNHSLETAELIAGEIQLGVEGGLISWEELGITQEELLKLLRKFPPAAYVSLVAKFKKLWQEYLEVEAEADSAKTKEVLERINPIFAQISHLISQHLLEPQALMFCKFFVLQEALKKLEQPPNQAL